MSRPSHAELSKQNNGFNFVFFSRKKCNEQPGSQWLMFYNIEFGKIKTWTKQFLCMNSNQTAYRIYTLKFALILSREFFLCTPEVARYCHCERMYMHYRTNSTLFFFVSIIQNDDWARLSGLIKYFIPCFFTEDSTNLNLHEMMQCFQQFLTNITHGPLFNNTNLPK